MRGKSTNTLLSRKINNKFREAIAFNICISSILTIIFIFYAFISCSDALIESKTAPNYLIILVHGINASSRVFVGQEKYKENGISKGEKGSDLSYEPKECDDFGDLKGYLENDLGLKGYVYSYTFSERDGRISNQSKELGDRKHPNDASNGSILIYPTMNHLAKFDSTYTKIKNNNCWLKQAREDFKNWYANIYSTRSA